MCFSRHLFFAIFFLNREIREINRSRKFCVIRYPELSAARGIEIEISMYNNWLFDCSSLALFLALDSKKLTAAKIKTKTTPVLTQLLVIAPINLFFSTLRQIFAYDIKHLSLLLSVNLFPQNRFKFIPIWDETIGGFGPKRDTWRSRAVFSAQD